MRRLGWLIAALPLGSGGCVARAAWDVATLPVKAGAKAVDLATVSAKERDEHYAHQQRKLAERREHDARAAQKAERARRRADRDRDRDRDRNAPHRNPDNA